MSWFAREWPQVLQLTLAHLGLSLPAILLSVLLAVPLGRLAVRFPRFGGGLLSAASLLYAIPALPLLVFVPALFGVPLRSGASIVIALTLYGVALMVRTAADAFRSVDETVRQAAIAIGCSARSLFWRVDLPLAVPVLSSGARVVAVSTVGLVTIGALVGVPSLGTLFTDGLQRGIAEEIAAGLVATVLLALALDGIVLLAGFLLTPWTRRAARSDADAGAGARTEAAR